MASSTDAPKRTFVVWAPDYTDPDAISRRLAVRAQHGQRVQQLTAEGFIKMGGPVSDPASEQLNGSLLVVEAESAAVVRAAMEKDIYYSSNVWDKEKLDIRLIAISVSAR